MSKQVATFVVNGRSYDALIEPRTTLLQVLRDQLDLTGTKYGCGIGECGFCTVLVDGKLTRACLTLAITARDKDIMTIEGLTGNGHLHPIQQAFIDNGAIQCGYCTPGMVLASKALLDINPSPSRQEVKEWLSGNLCRCTGYVKIVDAVLAASERLKEGGAHVR